MIAHEENADAVATLMTDPRWRCVWFDPVAAVFLTAEDPRRKRDYPAVDFADRYVRACSCPTIDPVESLVEAKVLAEIGSHMARRPATRWEVRAPLLILGACHARRVVAAGGHSPQAWTILGHCCWSLAPDLSQGPPDLEDPWDPATGLSWSQAAACYRRALEQSARNVPALLSLATLRDSPHEPGPRGRRRFSPVHHESRSCSSGPAAARADLHARGHGRRDSLERNGMEGTRPLEPGSPDPAPGSTSELRTLRPPLFNIAGSPTLTLRSSLSRTRSVPIDNPWPRIDPLVRAGSDCVLRCFTRATLPKRWRHPVAP